MSASAFDVIVVGGGVMGSATAWRLASRRISVLLLEQFERGHARGSSHGGSRIFRYAYSDPNYVTLAGRAYDLWRELEDEADRPLLEITGGVDHGDPAEVEAVAAALAAAGRSVERLTPEAAEERWPGFRFDTSVAHSPDTGRVLADDAVRALQDRAAALGCELRFSAPVTEIRGKTVAISDGETFTAAKAVVVTAGAWVEDLVAGAGLPHALPPLRVTREQVFHFAPRQGDGSEWPSFIHYRPRSHYGLCTPGEGIKVAEHGTGPETTGDGRTFVIDEIGRQRVVEYVKAWLPGLVPKPVTESTCLYTNTPDTSFVVDRHGDLVVGSPCSGHGFKFAPAIGEQLASLAVPR